MSQNDQENQEKQTPESDSKERAKTNFAHSSPPSRQSPMGTGRYLKKGDYSGEAELPIPKVSPGAALIIMVGS